MTTMIPLERMVFAKDGFGMLLNPRGHITDTTGLQSDMQHHGLDKPITVHRLHEDYVVNDGHRRVTAARALGWETIRAEIVEPPANDYELIARMIASDNHEPFKPSQLGQALATLVREGQWGIERAAQRRGIKPDRAQLLIDLALKAPESIQKRVDAGEMSLTAWRTIRDKPAAIQDQVAALEKPTVAAVRRVVKDDKTKGQMDNLLAQMNVEGSLAADIRSLRQKALSQWHGLPMYEQQQLIVNLSGLLDYLTSTAKEPETSQEAI